MKAVLKVLTLLIVVGMIASTIALADPCNERGKGKKWGVYRPGNCERWCAPPPEGCSYFECSKCGCDYLCPDGVVVTGQPPVWEIGSIFDTGDIMVPHEAPAGIRQPLQVRLGLARWPVPLL